MVHCINVYYCVYHIHYDYMGKFQDSTEIGHYFKQLWLLQWKIVQDEAATVSSQIRSYRQEANFKWECRTLEAHQTLKQYTAQSEFYCSGNFSWQQWIQSHSCEQGYRIWVKSLARNVSSYQAVWLASALRRDDSITSASLKGTRRSDFSCSTDSVNMTLDAFIQTRVTLSLNFRSLICPSHHHIEALEKKTLVGCMKH